MSKTLAVAGRELRERWLLFPAGLVLGFVPLVLPAFDLVSPEGVPTVGMAVSFLLGAVAAVVSGSSMLARDTADGRLGFLFSRPVSWPAIWGGKWLAALVLAVGCAGLATLPWTLVQPPTHPGDGLRGVLTDPLASTFFLALLLVAVGLANFNATAYRSRSPWVAVDLGLLLLALWAVWGWVAPLMPLVGVYQPMPRWRFFWVLAAPGLALLVASSVQVALGRTDLRRAHRALSVTFWTILFVFLAAAGLRLAWARAATPADLRWRGAWFEASSDPSGRWLYTSGPSRRGGEARFLIHTESGDYLPLGVSPQWGRPPFFRGMAFDADGSTGALLAGRGDGSALATADLAGGEPHFQWVTLESSPAPEQTMQLVLSASGSTAVLTHRHGVSLFRLPSGRRVATATVPAGWFPVAVRMLDESNARVWLTTVVDAHMADFRDEMRLLEVGVDREPRLAGFSLDPGTRESAFSSRPIPDTTGTRLLTLDGGVRLRDGATGALVVTLVETVAPVSARFVADGRIVVGEAVGARTLLHVFAPDGAPLGRTSIDRVPMGLRVGPQMAPGRVAIFFTPVLKQPETMIFDLDEVRIVATQPRLRPLDDWPRATSPGAVVSPLRTQIFTEGLAVVRVDDEEWVIAGPGARLGKRLGRREVGLE